ncbi:Gfo/Idh/MocA family oxidoreductase [Sporomusa sp. GT1]|uniref:Gfo/Idh/MocA family oxidoreductase n=1 Tax=Sporomusa sp. GT1 TaxID=1534747 RepID=UPI0016640F38|nr:Gfo/Idh/MocA family oxidoreductase [Sporomusa sp. GT1]
MKKVITYGSFDLFHEGHYRLLQRAKALGDYLIVGVTTEHYDESRGKLNIVDSLMERVENVKKTGFADKIIIEDHTGQKIEDIQKYQVDVFTVGSDWIGMFDYLKHYCEVVYLERTKGISSTMKRAQNYKIIRLGIVGSGRIAGRFIPEAKFVSGLNIEGVYNPRRESAERFAAEHSLAFATDDEEEFYEHVDAVNIASPHETHYGYIKRALEHGKHVLCEKPMLLQKAQAEEVFDLAKEKNCILMEALKTAYVPGFIRLISLAKSGVIGEIRDVESCFTRLTPSHLREVTDIRNGGSFTEFGSYTLLPIIKLLGTDYQDVYFKSFLADNGVDIYTKAYFNYGGNIATSKTGLKIKSDGHLLISGTRGYIFVPAPWWLTKEFEICYEDFTQNEKVYTKFLGDGLRYELSDFIATINGHSSGGFKLTRDESVALAGLMEKFLEQRSQPVKT